MARDEGRVPSRGFTNEQLSPQSINHHDTLFLPLSCCIYSLLQLLRRKSSIALFDLVVLPDCIDRYRRQNFGSSVAGLPAYDVGLPTQEPPISRFESQDAVYAHKLTLSDRHPSSSDLIASVSAPASPPRVTSTRERDDRSRSPSRRQSSPSQQP